MLKIRRPEYKPHPGPVYKVPFTPREELPTYVLNRLLIVEQSWRYPIERMKKEIELHNHVADVVERYVNKWLRLEPWEEELLAETTTAHPYVKPSHNYLSEHGTLSFSKDLDKKTLDKVYSKEKLERLLADIKGWTEKPATYPRRKNTGIPIIVAGMNAALNDIILSVWAVMAHTTFSLLRKGASSQDLLNLIVTTFNKWFPNLAFIEFSRVQHTDKEMFKLTEAGWIMTKNLEGRVRIIQGTVKPIAMINKFFIKTMSDANFNTPGSHFMATPEELQRRHGANLARGWVPVALDQSRFDLHHGRSRLTHTLKVWAEVLARKLRVDPYPFFMYESGMPAYIITETGVALSEPYDGIRSGDSKTSRMTSLINACEHLYILETAGAKGEWYDFIVMGDDMIAWMPPDVAAAYKAAIPKVADELGIKIDLEEPPRFIGKYPQINSRKVFGNRGSHIQSAVWPERSKHPSALLLSIWARIEIAEKDGRDGVQLYRVYRDIFNELAKHVPAIQNKYRVLGRYGLSELPERYDKAKTIVADMVRNAAKLFPNAYEEIDAIITFMTKGANYDTDVEVNLAGERLSGSEQVTLEDLLPIVEKQIKKGSGSALERLHKAILYLSNATTSTQLADRLDYLLKEVWMSRSGLNLRGPKGPGRDYLMDGSTSAAITRALAQKLEVSE
jgi:hypothetical protein